MFTPFAAPILGPSLPPNVNSEVIGTLTICFQECSVIGAFARIQFWGEKTFSDLHPKQRQRSSGIGTENENRLGLSSEDAIVSPAVRYPLVGSRFALYKYLQDASPLKVSFSRHQKCTSSAQPEFLGCASIPDIGIAELLTPEAAQNDTPKTINISLRREMQVSTHGPGVNGSNFVGEALFELIYQVNVLAAPSQLRGESKMQKIIQHQSIPPNQRIDPVFKQDQVQQSQAHISCIHDYDSTQSIIGESIELHSSLCTRNDEEKQSLLEELLNLCTDDMTIPTLCSANTAFDPYDMWISRMVASASSPPTKEFPSLVAAGSHQSSALQRVGSLKIEIYDLTLFSSVANSIKGKHDFVLQYNPPPHACTDSTSGSVEFVVCQQFGTQTRTKSSRRTHPTFTKSVRDVPLLSSNHKKHMEVVFKDDDSVRRWLEGMVEFRLFSCASKPTSHPKLPRVATLAGNRINSATPPDRVCIAQACLRLRNIVLSDILASDMKLDLALVNNKLLEIGKVGENIGSLSVRLGLHPGDKCTDHSTPCSQTNSADGSAKTSESMHISVEELHSSLSSTPHPISLFLSAFAGASNNLDGKPSSGNQQQSLLPQHSVPYSANINTKKKQTRRIDATCASSCPVEANQRGPLPQQCFLANEEQTAGNVPRGKRNINLKPVKAPPVWLNIRIQCISNLTIEAVSGKSNSLRLSMSCNKPLLSIGNVAHLQSRSKGVTRSMSLGSEIPSQAIAKLRNCCSNVFSLNTVHSWQVAIEADQNGDKDALLVLHVYHCSGSDDEPSYELEKKTLVGLAKIPFLCEPTIDSQYKICNWLPDIAAINWFNVIDPKSNNTIGRIQVMVAAGMLRQIRVFANTYTSILKVQGWWRKNRANKVCVVNQDSILKGGPTFGEVHEELFFRNAPKQMDDPASSPDSLFEEWSQQSSSVARVHFSNSREYGDPISVDKPAAKCIQQKIPESANSSKTSGHDEITGVLTPEDWPKAIDTLNSCTGADTEQTPCSIVDKSAAKCIQQKIPVSANSSKTSGRDEITGILTSEEGPEGVDTLNSRTGADTEQTPCKNAVDQFEVLVHLEKVSGLQEMLSMWTKQQGNSDNNRLLSVSGFFVSYSIIQESAAMSQQEELHKLCFGEKVRHSKLVPAETITRDVELNWETSISIPNHEKNTDMILAQMLEFKLWFVPIITTAIGAMINKSKMKDTQAINGCKVISTAECPLYHLYTLQGYYSGRVPWNMAAHKDRNGIDFIGCIWTSVRRANIQNNQLRFVAENHNMSILKPLNLEDNFSRGQYDHATGIDPPEEIKQPCRTSSSKRKIENSSIGVRGFKKYRWVTNPETATTKQPHDIFNGDPTGEESENVYPRDASFECETEDALAYHSLNSVMKSLENINTKLQQVSSFAEPQQKTVVCDDLRVSSQADPCLDNTDGDLGYKHTGCQMEPPEETLDPDTPTDEIAKSNVGMCDDLRVSSQADPCLDNTDGDLGYKHTGRQMEPPEETLDPDTPTDKIAKSNVGIVKIKTFEKGSSPMSMIYHCADAATSPCGERIEDTGVGKDDHFVHQKYVVEKKNADDKKGDVNPTGRNQSDTIIQHLKQSDRRRESNSRSKHQSMHDHHTKSREYLHGISRKDNSFKTHSYPRDLLTNGTYQARERMLSPVLDSMCTTRHAFLARSRRFFPDNGSSKEQSHSLGNNPVATRVLHDKDRLERIFLS